MQLCIRQNTERMDKIAINSMEKRTKEKPVFYALKNILYVCYNFMLYLGKNDENSLL